MTFDIRRDEDLSLAIMNLISLEEHAYFTAEKTGDRSYLDMLARFRRMRTELLGLIVTDAKGEQWCMSKHLLSTTMRLIETANKYRPQDQGLSDTLYDYAFDTYSLFWHINDTDTQEPAQTIARLRKEAEADTPSKKRMESMLGKARDLVKKAIDCCKEL